MQPLTLYRHNLSGHSHRVELFLSLLNLKFDMREVDLANGEHKTSEYLTLNKYGQVPVIADGENVLSDSIAILVYLANKYAPDSNWNPSDPILTAQIQKYFSLASGPIANGPAAARLVKLFGAAIDHTRATEIASTVLTVLDNELETRMWLVGDEPTIADVAVYTYVAHAPEGGVSLDDYLYIRGWLSRIEALPGFVPMVRTEINAPSTRPVAAA